jgi:hypothetical protein
MFKLQCCRGSSLVERRPEKAGVASSILAPGTTHACERLFPEKVYPAVGSETELSAFFDLFQRELPNLLGQQRSRFVNCVRLAQTLLPMFTLAIHACELSGPNLCLSWSFAW